MRINGCTNNEKVVVLIMKNGCTNNEYHKVSEM